MHIRSKFDGGKQINRSQAGSWQGWCAGAGLRCNEGAGWGPTTWQKAVHTEPSNVFKLAAADAIKRTDMDRKRKATAAAKLQRKKARYSTTAVDNSLSSRMAYSRYVNFNGTILVDRRANFFYAYKHNLIMT